jgi:hypothetical protein
MQQQMCRRPIRRTSSRSPVFVIHTVSCIRFRRTFVTRPCATFLRDRPALLSIWQSAEIALHRLTAVVHQQLPHDLIVSGLLVPHSKSSSLPHHPSCLSFHRIAGSHRGGSSTRATQRAHSARPNQSVIFDALRRMRYNIEFTLGGQP